MSVRHLKTDDPRWEPFVLGFPEANIFSSPQMMDVFRKSQGFTPHPLFAFSGDDVVAAAFPVLVGMPSRLPGRLVNRLIMYATPLHEHSDRGRRGLAQVLDEAKALARSTSLFLEIRNSHPFPPDEAEADVNRLEYLPYENYLIHLEEGTGGIWASLNSYTRNHIRKGVKKGAVVREAESGEMGVVIGLLETLYTAKRIPFIGASVFEEAHARLTPRGMMRTTVMDVDGRIVGARITLQYARTMFDWYASSEGEFKGWYPNEALAWDAMCWAHDHGYTTFDFGGGAIRGQEYGPAAFKEKFRGEKVEYGRYRHAPNPLLFRLARLVYAMKTGNKG